MNNAKNNKINNAKNNKINNGNGYVEESNFLELNSDSLKSDNLNYDSLNSDSMNSDALKSQNILKELKHEAEVNEFKATLKTDNKSRVLPPPNYDGMMKSELTKILSRNIKPTLLLHSCCAPCSSYVLKLLQKYFQITVYFYNSNLFPLEEYNLRLDNQIKLINILNKEAEDNINNKKVLHEVFYETKIEFVCGEYKRDDYRELIKGYEHEFEGGNRCYLCYLMRINKAGELASQNNFDYFTTTLTVSPYKNSFWVNKIGRMVSEKWGVNYLYSDFKKNDGYKKSVEYSKEYGLYRQEYCGCQYSLMAKKSSLT